MNIAIFFFKFQFIGLKVSEFADFHLAPNLISLVFAGPFDLSYRRQALRRKKISLPAILRDRLQVRRGGRGKQQSRQDAKSPPWRIGRELHPQHFNN
jgi:hypothetical protein